MVAKMIARRSVILLAAVAGACAVGPSTRAARQAPMPAVEGRVGQATTPAARAFLDSLARVRGAEHGVPDAAAPLQLDSARDVRWLGLLRDSQLVALVNVAVRNNQTVRAAAARVLAYRDQVTVARSQLLPQLSLNTSTTSSQTIFGNSLPAQSDAVRLTGDVQWELDLWGRARRSTEAAQLDWLTQEDDRRAVVLSLVSGVATGYLELREADQDVRIAEEAAAARRATLELARKRFAQGLISELDVRQFESEVASSAISVAQFAQRRVEAENQLSLLAGLPPSSIPRGSLSASPSDAPVLRPVDVPDSIPSEMLAARPDVRRAERAWQAATARVGAAEASRLPRLFVAGQYGTQRPGQTGLFQPNGEIYTLQAGISLPLFTGGRLQAQQDVAQAQVMEARATLEQTRLNAMREASNALAAVRFTRDQLAAQETQVRALTRALDLARQRYGSGVSSYLEVLDAQRSLFAAQIAFARVQREHNAAAVQLYHTLGGAW